MEGETEYVALTGRADEFFSATLAADPAHIAHRLVEEVPSGGRIARHQPLVFGGKGHGGDQTHDIPHILRFSAVHARPVGASRGDGDLICALFARIFDVGPDSGGRVAFFDQRQR